MLKEFANLENELVQKAPERYGDLFPEAEQLVLCFPHEAFEIADVPAGKLFNLFWCPVRTNLALMLLSAVREHTCQMTAMARRALEAGCIAGYSLSQKQVADEWAQGKHDDAEMGKLFSKANAYPWVKKNFLAESENIETAKSLLSNYVHANVRNATLHCGISDNKMCASFFDSSESEIINTKRIVLCEDVTLHILTLIANVARRYPGTVTLRDDFDGRYRAFSQKVNLRGREFAG